MIKVLQWSWYEACGQTIDPEAIRNSLGMDSVFDCELKSGYSCISIESLAKWSSIYQFIWYCEIFIMSFERNNQFGSLHSTDADSGYSCISIESLTNWSSIYQFIWHCGIFIVWFDRNNLFGSLLSSTAHHYPVISSNYWLITTKIIIMCKIAWSTCKIQFVIACLDINRFFG